MACESASDMALIGREKNDKACDNMQLVITWPPFATLKKSVRCVEPYYQRDISNKVINPRTTAG